MLLGRKAGSEATVGRKLLEGFLSKSVGTVGGQSPFRFFD
jgi:hypothetical protein